MFLSTHHLNQSKVWTNRQGRTLQISDMDTEHRQNSLAMLQRNAKSIARKYMFLAHMALPLPGETGEMAYDCLLRELETEMAQIDRDPVAWITATPLALRLAQKSRA